MTSGRFVAPLVLCILVAGVPAGADYVAVDGPNDELTVNNYCSLREAIRAAIEEDPLWSVQHGCAPGNGNDTILLPAGRYHLPLGQLEITGDSNNLKFEPVFTDDPADAVILDAGDAHRVAWVHFQTGDVTFERITFTNGGNITGGDTRGGALLIEVVEVFLETCSVYANFAEQGGGAFLYEAVLHIDNSSFSNNYADAPASTFTYGGAIFADNSVVYATNSTLSYNNAGVHGGAIYLDPISTAWLRHTTISDNNCGFGNFVDGNGGGVFLSISATLNLAHTIIADNHDLGSGAYDPDCGGDSGVPTSYHHNIVGDASGCGIVAQSTDLFGSPGNLVDPGLEVLARNVKGTESHTPKISSVAVGGGSFLIGANFSACLGPVDQRGVTRPQCVNDPGFCYCDIGAIELDAADQIFADGFESGNTSAWN